MNHLTSGTDTDDSQRFEVETFCNLCGQDTPIDDLTPFLIGGKEINICIDCFNIQTND